MGEGAHAEWFAWFKAILKVRREWLPALLREPMEDCGTFEVIGPGALSAEVAGWPEM